MSRRDTFDLSPQQYHAGLDKLWEALGLTGVQDEDVFTLAARRIKEQKTALENLQTEVLVMWKSWHPSKLKKATLVLREIATSEIPAAENVYDENFKRMKAIMKLRHIAREAIGMDD